MKTLKHIYILSGLLFLITAITSLVWFYDDFIYLFTNPTAHTPLARFTIFVCTLLFGAFYLWYGIKSARINRLSNFSLAILVLTLVTTFILVYVLGCSYIGGICPDYSIIARNIMPWVLEIGLIVSAILILASIFKK